MKSLFKTQDIVFIALCASLLSICAQITIPAVVPFTMQTFAIVLSGMLLKKKCSITSIILYLLLGISGMPVFSGFRSGIGVVIGTGGGYMFGWLFLIYFSSIAREYKTIRAFLICCIGLLICYAFGTAWYALIYSAGNGIAAILSVSVFPFIFPDIVKIFLAILCAEKIKKQIPFDIAKKM